MRMWIKQILGLLLMVQLALLPLQGVSATFVDVGSMHDVHQMESGFVPDSGFMTSMDCVQDHDMSNGHCSDHSCPSCQCASCLLIRAFRLPLNLYSTMRFSSPSRALLSPSLDELYRPPRV